MQQAPLMPGVLDNGPNPRWQPRLQATRELLGACSGGATARVPLVDLEPGGLVHDHPVGKVQRDARAGARTSPYPAGAAHGSAAWSPYAVEGPTGLDEPLTCQRQQPTAEQACGVQRPDHAGDADRRGRGRHQGGDAQPHLELSGELREKRLCLPPLEGGEGPRQVGQVLQRELLHPHRSLLGQLPEDALRASPKRGAGPGHIGQGLRRELAQSRSRVLGDHTQEPAVV
mmetsp:Transcript_44731/g.140186  ORF Transcript_44731/g.140186 Transcript_44731/m.140186 type:complete len:229 (+) Transcript_44731:650-1336(+)